MKVKAAVLYEVNQPIVVEEVDVDGPKAGEVLVKIAATGVCHSCYSVITGKEKWPLPAVLGDEGAGVVEAVGSGVSLVKPGDHVVLSISPACGHCIYCVRGYASLCLKAAQMRERPPRYSKNGKGIYQFTVASFAEYTVVPQEAAVPIDQDLPLDKAALCGCSVIAGVGSVANTAEVKLGSSVVVIGAGGIGLNAIQGAALAGAAQIIAVDLVEAKLEMARQFGATHTINASNGDPISEIHALTEGLGADYAIEAIGTNVTYEQAIRAIRPRGKAILIGLPQSEPICLEPQLLMNGERIIMGSALGSTRMRYDVPRLISLYRAGKLKLDELITQTYPLEAVNEAFEDMLNGKVARGVIRL